jgi:hypothetical protein
MLRVVFNKLHLAPLALALAVGASGAAEAHGPRPRNELAPTRDAEGRLVPPPAWSLSLGGYADLQFAWHDYGPNQNRPGGAQKDSRLVFDTTRFVLELEGMLPLGLEFEAELEVEHHGAGAALELEYEEFGEYEQEVEAGGEVILEEIYLRKTFGPVGLQLGRFYLGVGLLSEIYRPTEYRATGRPESETTVLPAVWHELGLQVDVDLAPVKLTAQIVNGLDSTGFSSQRWIASGHQTRMELVSASDLAFVLRADLELSRGVTLGVSGYYGNTSRNRSKPDLVPECASTENEVAPCGYVQAAVTLLDFHFRLDLDPFTAQGVVLWGHLDNAKAVSDRNSRLSNALGVLRSPVASEALFAWLELGVDLADVLCLGTGHHLEPFFRFDYYDTMFGVEDGVFDNNRFARAVYTAGLGWSYGDLVFAKLDLSYRDLGGFETAALRDETSIRLSTGFGF